MKHVREPELDGAGRAAQIRDLIRRSAYREAQALLTAGVVLSETHVRLLLPYAAPPQARLLARALLDAGEVGEWLYRTVERMEEPSLVEGGRAPAHAHGALTAPLEEAVSHTGEATLVLCGVEIPLLWDELRARLFACDVAERGLNKVLAEFPLDQSLMQAVDGARRYAWSEIDATQLVASTRQAHQFLRMLGKYNIQPPVRLALSVALNAAEVTPHLDQICGLACVGDEDLPGFGPPSMTLEEMQALLIAYYLGERP
jgi:hypothetical protein